MKKISIILLLALLFLTGCQQNETKKEEMPVATKEQVNELVEFNQLIQFDEKEYQQYLAEQKSGIVYAGWIVECGDSRNFQVNYLENLLVEYPSLKDNLVIFNLEKDHLAALKDKELRQPLIDNYQIGFSPTLLLIQEGKVQSKIEWTLKNHDPFTAIPKAELDVFFENSGYLKK